MMYILILLSLVVIHFVFDFSIKKEGSVKVLYLFVTFAFIYYLGLPFELILKGTSFGPSGFISDRVLSIIISMGVLSLVGFLLGFYSSGFKMSIVDSLNVNKNKLLFVSVILLFIVSGIALITIFRDSLLSSSTSYSGNFTETYNSPFYAYAKEVFFTSIAILITLLNLKGRWYLLGAILLSCLLIVFSIYTRDKDPLLLFVLSWALFFFQSLTRMRIQRVLTYWVLFILMVFTIPTLSLLFGLNRGGVVSAFANQIEMNGIYKNFDATGPLVSLVELIEEPNVKFEYGKSYYWGFIGWIPKSIWPNRPLDLSEAYAKEKISNWQPGQGLGYSLMTEAYKNFGVAGAVIQYFFIGLLLGLLGRFHQWLFKEPVASAVFFIWMSYSIAIMHRGPFNLPSTYLRFVLPIFLLYYSIYGSLYIWKRWIIRTR